MQTIISKHVLIIKNSQEEVLIPEPRDYGLERPVGAAPSVIVKVVLHVVVVSIITLHQSLLTRDS